MSLRVLPGASGRRARLLAPGRGLRARWRVAEGCRRPVHAARPAGSPVEMSLRVCLALWAAGVAWGPAAASGPAGEWSKAAASRYMPRACQGARPK